MIEVKSEHDGLKPLREKMLEALMSRNGKDEPRSKQIRRKAQMLVDKAIEGRNRPNCFGASFENLFAL